MKPSGAPSAVRSSGPGSDGPQPGVRAFRGRTIALTASAVVVAALLIAFGVRLLSREREQALALWDARLSSMATDRQAAIEAWIAERTNDLSVIGSLPTIVEILSAGPERPVAAAMTGHASDILERIVEGEELAAVAVLDRGGRLLASTGLGRLPGWVAPAEHPPSSGSASPSVLLAHFGGGKTVVAVESAAPGAAKGDSPAGRIVLFADPATYIFPLLTRDPVQSRTGESLLLRREGDRVVFLSPLRFDAAAPGTLSLPVSACALVSAPLLAENLRPTEVRDYRGRQVLAAGRRIAGTDWAIVAKVDLEEALATATVMARRGAALLAGLLIGLAALTWGIWRNEHAYRMGQVARSEESYRRFLRQARDAIFLVEPTTGRILDANPSAETMHSRSSDELKALTVADLRPPSERSEVPSQIATARTTGLLVEATHLRGDGTPFPVEISSGGGEVEGRKVLISIVRDTSARQESLEREALLNRLLQTLSAVNELIVRETDEARVLEGVCRIAVEQGGFRLAWIGAPDAAAGRIVKVAAFGEMGYAEGLEIHADASPLGLGPTGRAFRERRTVVVDDWETDASVEPWRVRARLHGFRASGAFPLGREERRRGVLTVYSSLSGFFLPEVVALVERMAGNVSFALDAIEQEARRREAERALAESEERLRLAVEGAGQGIWDLDLRTGIEKTSPEYDRMLGWAAGERPGGLSTWEECLHPDDRERAAGTFRKYLAGEIPSYRLEFRLGTKDGGWKWILSTGSIVERLPDGTPARVIGTHTDITTAKELEAQVLRLNADLEERVQRRTAELEAANRDLESFSYSVSHDLRAPLRAIDGFGKILEEEHAGALSAEGGRLLGVIRTNTRKMGSLIDDLLAFSRAGRTDLRRIRINMSAVAQSAWDEVLPQEDRGRSELVLGPLPEAVGDPGLMRQVWVNLLSNAVKFTSRNPSRRVEVGSRSGPDGDEWFVRDDGVGFDMRYHAKLFGVFARLHGPREFEGTGVGLALVQRIVARHGGAVHAVGEPGRGATFSFSLPRSG